MVSEGLCQFGSVLLFIQLASPCGLTKRLSEKSGAAFVQFRPHQVARCQMVDSAGAFVEQELLKSKFIVQLLLMDCQTS